MVTIPNTLSRKFSDEGLTLDKSAGAWLVQDSELAHVLSWCRQRGHLVVAARPEPGRPDPLPYPDLARPQRQPDDVAARGAANARQALAKARAREDDDANAAPPPRDSP